jgi:putative redox protein
MSGARELVITLPGDRRIEAQVGHHVLRTDQPLDNGGGDTAASPFELFLASIGTCAGIFVQGFCAKRGIAFEEIRIQERVDFDEQGVLRSVDLELQLPASFPARYREAILQVVEQCSVKRAIAAQPKFSVRTSTPAG